jgi:hypothetical protein
MPEPRTMYFFEIEGTLHQQAEYTSEEAEDRALVIARQHLGKNVDVYRLVPREGKQFPRLWEHVSTSVIFPASKPTRRMV